MKNDIKVHNWIEYVSELNKPEDHKAHRANKIIIYSGLKEKSLIIIPI